MVTGNEPKVDGLLKPGAALPDFSLSDASGKQLSFDDVKGKVTLIDFWGTWCGPCLLSMPKLQVLHEKYGDKGLAVVGISVSDKPGKAEKYVEKKGYGYQFLVQGDTYARDLKLDTYPTVYIVDEQGVVLHAEKGNRAGAHEAFERIIEKQIKSKGQ